MRRSKLLIPLLAAVLLVNAAPLRAGESYDYYPDTHSRIDAQKDECLLVAMNCTEQPDSPQQKIERLQKEINKGTDVYSTEELKVLDKILKDTIEEERLLMKE